MRPNRSRVYLAGPLFTQAERAWNTRFANGLHAAGLAVTLPQETGLSLVRPGEPLPVRALYESCLEGIRAADVVVAILDGPDPDSGTAFECGYAVALGKPMVSVRTDLRLGGDDPAHNVNLMLSQSSAASVRVTADDLPQLVEKTIDAIAKL